MTKAQWQKLTALQKTSLVSLILLAISMPIFVIASAYETRIDGDARRQATRVYNEYNRPAFGQSGQRYDTNSVQPIEVPDEFTQRNRAQYGRFLPTPLPNEIAQPPIDTPALGCKVSGCNGELCVNAGAEDIASTCVYKPEFACYRTAKCEIQTSTGNCGWTQTVELTQCINESGTNHETQLEVIPPNTDYLLDSNFNSSNL